MTPQEFQTLIFSNVNQITNAITTGSAWELWMQAELCLLVRGSGLQAARELPYPTGKQKLDLGFKDTGGLYAVELKVESATNAGQSFAVGLNMDIEKIQFYSNDGLCARWVVGLAYSAEGVRILEGLFNRYQSKSTYRNQGGIGIIVISVA